MVLHHPAYAKLLEYSTKGCLVKTGRNWLKEEIRAAVMRGPHESALSKKDIANLVATAKLKMDTKQSRLVWYQLINYKLPEQMKVPSIAEITHKYKAFRSIIDLAFSLWLIPQGWFPSVNEDSEKTAPAGAINQIGNVIMQLIFVFTEAQDESKIFQAKWDIKDGFWILDFREG